MLSGIAENLISDTIQDLIMQDILLEIIKNNEVSQIVDRQIEKDRLIEHIAEGVMRETVMRMLSEEIAMPQLTVAESEKKALK